MATASARSNYTRGQRLTAGEHGAQNEGIYLVVRITTGIQYIEKRVHHSRVNSRHAEREIRAMQSCRGQANIIQLQDFDLSTPRGYGSIYMEWCERGSLETVIQRFMQHGRLLPDAGFLWKVLWDLSLALCFLKTGTPVEIARERALGGHRVRVTPGWNQIIHRDIKPGNVFLRLRGSGSANLTDRYVGVGDCPYPTVVLGDFGASVTTEDVQAGIANRNHYSEWDPRFETPEFPVYDERGDMYTMALTVHCLGRMRQAPTGSITDRIRYPLPPWYGANRLTSVLRQCWEQYPVNRPTADCNLAVVLDGYRRWRNGRADCGQALPGWTFQ